MSGQSSEEIKFRSLLAMVYCGYPHLYCDDGELQDNREFPLIDFKRDTADEIRRKMHERMATKILAKDQP